MSNFHKVISLSSIYQNLIKNQIIVTVIVIFELYTIIF